MIFIKDLNFTYKGSTEPALKNINLDIKKGDFVGIIGESGAGKSTLTYTINGAIPHHYGGDFYGAVEVNHLDTFETKLEELTRYVGSVFQDIDGQMIASVVEDELLFGLENFGVPREEIEERITEALEAIGISDLRYRNISSLSGGQKQKVALCAIIALKPDILVLDEPTGELDPKSSRQIFTLLKFLNETYGMTIVVVEQKIMLLCEYVRNLVVMREGAVVYDGKVRDVLKHSRELENLGVNCPRVVTLANSLTDAGLNNNSVCLDVPEAGRMIRRIVSGNLWEDGPAEKQVFRPNTVASHLQASETMGDGMIDFEEVCFAYHKKEIIKDITFQIPRGDFVAVIGANGAGKTTISKLFNGLLKPSKGKVKIKGMDTQITKTSELARYVGLLFQNPDKQICQNTIKEEILFGLRCVMEEESLIRDRCDTIIKEFAFTADRDPFTLSRGERQRIALASILAIQPEILILDEPTTGLDYRECIHIMESIKEMNEGGTTVIMISHDMELVLDYAKSVMVMNDGRLLAYGLTKEILYDRELLGKASLLPPQIAELSLELGGAFSNIFTVSDMVKAVENEVNEGRDD